MMHYERERRKHHKWGQKFKVKMEYDVLETALSGLVNTMS